jgi:hypothetical protein
MFEGFSELGLLGFSSDSASAMVDFMDFPNADLGLKISQDLIHQVQVQLVCFCISIHGVSSSDQKNQSFLQ